ncbi:hypothetical protein N0V94_007406 [Neodidymelliopsis sp. IMI 364377]|nr:hypothetical protein N0V94_007406 [Neodidymelliopsis sp. IMI 364377]
MTSILSLVDIGTHSLALYPHGSEPVSSKDPVVLFISGVASSSLSWAAVIRLLPPWLRSYTYDRSGYGNSELSPLEPSAENIALELSLLIKRAPILNPIIFVGHSWAGVIINEFIALTGNGPHIAGLVLVDANHESAPLVLNVNDPDLQILSEGIEGYSGKGIDVEHRLTPGEWDALMEDESTEKYEAIAHKEDEQYALSFETLQKKELSRKYPLVGDKPILVIGSKRSRDWNRLYEAGVVKGNGTEEQRSRVRELILTADEKSEGLMKQFLKLSTRSKLVSAGKSGHFIQLTQPDVVADGVMWVLDQSGTAL